ncbi:MAG: DUF4290 domain-containing protein [Prevotella sp.]|nr:DUF4290 domain-containing protein [Prevotella sp.]MDY5684977.1 DUF4290 domain-containing protein [Prevotella sp.]
MNIEGLDYNTQRERLILPEYGREVQSMVDHAVGIADRDRRQQCANAIIAIMKRMFPHSTDSVDNERKLWDHLALMSDFKLDIDYPYDVEQAQTIHAKPEPMSYPMRQIPVRHYGNMMFELFGRLKTMPAGKERDELIRLVANQMKRDLTLWGHGSSDDEKVASDLAEYTDGKVQLDLGTFKFDRTVIKDNDKKRKKK